MDNSEKYDVQVQRPSSPLTGPLSTIPADKAICHRVALLCALANGSTTITPWSTAEDCQRTLDVLRGLGVKIDEVPGGIRVDGVGLNGLKPPMAPLNCGESGTTMRLVCGLLAGQPFESKLTAEGSLCYRPMRRVVEPLSQMGARFHPPVGQGEIYPPLEITGTQPLKDIKHLVPVASAQVKSAILLAGLYAKKRTEVIERILTRDHTEQLLKHFGVSVRGPFESDAGISVQVDPVKELRSPGQLSIPADPSSAAFFIVAALLVPDSEITIHNVGLNPTRIHFLRVLKERMGADLTWPSDGTGWEPRGTVIARGSRLLKGAQIGTGDAAAMIDELPILMVAACAAEGETWFQGIQELKVKESDRLQAMKDGLSRLGVILPVTAEGNMKINGRSGKSQAIFRGATVESAGDHRIAMSLAVAGLIAEGETRIRGAECVRKSFGNFFDLLKSVAGSAAVTPPFGCS